MRIKYFGDSYDIVKQALLRWLGAPEQWAVHPMLTEKCEPQDIARLGGFLGARIVSNAVLSGQTDRVAYFQPASQTVHLLLDPDTGVRLQRPTSKGVRRRIREFVFADELIALVGGRPETITLVFDQSFDRRNRREQVAGKLAHFASNGIYGLAYVSHACFLLLSTSWPVVQWCHSRLLEESKLPPGCFVLSSQGSTP